MIITEWEMYWITRLDGIGTFFTLMAIFAWGIGGFIGLYYLCKFIKEHSEERKKLLIILAISVWLSVESVLMVGSILVPSTKSMVAILAIPAISRNEDMQEIPGNMAKFINKNLQEWVKDMMEDPSEDSKTP